jgi:C1A family cysteine protease/predicted secreted protein
MKLIGIHANKRVAAWLICVILLLSSLLPFTNAVAAPPLDDPDHGEVRLSAKDDSRQIELKEGQVLVISLESNPSTGYTWEIEEAKETILRQTGKTEFKPESGPLGAPALLGAPGKQILRFEAVAAGQTTLRLVYRRPWEKGAKPAKAFSLQVQGVGLFTQPKSPAPTPTAEPPLESPVLPAEQPMLGLPAYYNWCDPGNDGCTSVKDQGNCGSCWAFGTVGPLESNILIQDGLVKDLSEQYLVSCNTDGWGCNGGWWAHDYHLNKIPPGEPDAGAVYEADFPYQAANVSCNPPHAHHEKIVSWRYVGSEYGIPPVDDIKQAILDHSPVSAAVCVGSAFQGYSGGIFQTNETCTGYVNHAVVLVGWDDNQGVWYLRNSWGPSWGESGYMRIKYGTSKVGYAANYIIYSGGSCQDAYEADDTFDDARSITVNGAVQRHTFHESDDEDWVQFAVTAGETYTMTTSNLGAGNDTVLELYDTDGMTKLIENNDCPGSEDEASCINNWSAPDSNTYFIKVRRYLDSTGGGGVKIYLPVIMKSGSSVNCSDHEYDLAIVDSSGCSDTQVVQNGGFESGNTIWVQSSGMYYIIGPSWQGYYPRNSSWSAWFGGYHGADDQLYQTINVPANISSARLVFYLYVSSEGYDPIPYDNFHVELRDNLGGTLESFLPADSRMSSSQWWVGTMEWDDFSSYAGQTLRLFFRGITNDSRITNFFVDDVTLWTYCGGLPTGASKEIGPEGWTWQKAEAPPGYMPAPYSEELRRKVKNE